MQADAEEKAAAIEKLEADTAAKAETISGLEADAAEKAKTIETLRTENGTVKEELAQAKEDFEDLKALFIETFASSTAGSLSNAPADGEIQVIKRFRIDEKQKPNVRRNPGFDSRIIGHAAPGTVYEVLEVSANGWYKIQLGDGKTGWVYNTVGTLEELDFNFADDGEKTE